MFSVEYHHGQRLHYLKACLVRKTRSLSYVDELGMSSWTPCMTTGPGSGKKEWVKKRKERGWRSGCVDLIYQLSLAFETFP